MFKSHLLITAKRHGLAMSRSVVAKLFLLVLLFSLGGVSCSRQDEHAQSYREPLRIGVLPDEGIETLKARFLPLLEHVSNQAGFSFELIIPKSYQDLVEMFQKQQLDMARFGATTFVIAKHHSHAVPLVMRDADIRFSSCFLVRADSALRKLTDCRGKKLSFGSKLSTSGHLMPRYFLRERGIDPEAFFSEILYSDTHDRTAVGVRDGTVDIGVANTHIVDQLFEDGVLSREQIRVLWKTPPYIDYVWAVRPEMPSSLRNRIRDAFLMLTVENPDHALILERVGATHYLPANADDFDEIQVIVDQMHLLDNEY